MYCWRLCNCNYDEMETYVVMLQLLEYITKQLGCKSPRGDKRTMDDNSFDDFMQHDKIIQELTYFLRPVEFDRILCYNGIRTSNRRGVIMEITKKISYAPLWKTLIDKNIKKKTDLLELVGIGSGTLAKMSKNQEVSMNVILRICQSLDCELVDVIEIVD